MATYVRGSNITNATTYELFEKSGGGTTTPSGTKNEATLILADGTLGTAGAASTLSYTFSGLSSLQNASQIIVTQGWTGSTPKMYLCAAYNGDTLLGITCRSVGSNKRWADIVLNDGSVTWYASGTASNGTPGAETTIDWSKVTKINIAGTTSTNEGQCTPILTIKGGNATYTSKGTASSINFEVSALGLSSGDHTFVVKAKGSGYTDSDYSNEVTYTV